MAVSKMFLDRCSIITSHLTIIGAMICDFDIFYCCKYLLSFFFVKFILITRKIISQNIYFANFFFLFFLLK